MVLGVAACAWQQRLRPLLCFWLLLWAGVSVSHPLSHGTLALVVHADRVELRARVTVEEAVLTGMLVGPTTLDEASRTGWHAQYLLDHLHLVVDEAPWVGRISAVYAPGQQPPGVSLPDPAEHAVYDLVFEPARPADGQGLPQQLSLRQNVLTGVQVAPGVSWEASYTVSIRTAVGARTDGLLLTPRAPLSHLCSWDPLVADPAQASTATAVVHGPLFRDYLAHGFHHILVGYDHLLFIAALVLVARSMWDLIKIVTAFTLAHTLTLTLAALGWVALPSSLIEPMIALSIVIVAAQNLWWPQQARGSIRLAVAAGFGLFHGLGFAGGLLDAMQSLSGSTIALAIVAFSIGVELGHQLIVIPLFALLKLVGRARAASRAREPTARQPMARQLELWGSLGIGLAGLYYLAAALQTAWKISAA